MKDILSGAKLKIGRANEHIAELTLRLRGYTVDPDSYHVSVEYNANTGCHELRVRSRFSIPTDRLMPVVGDAIHNLRAALDYAYFAVLPVGLVDSKSQFPFRDSREELITAIEGGLKKKGAPSELLETIVDRIQPYPSGKGDALWRLHRLDIEDKHRILIAKTQLTFIRGIRLKNETGKEIPVEDWLLREHKVASLAIFGHKSLHVTNNGDATASIVFGEFMPLQGSEIVPALVDLGRQVATAMVALRDAGEIIYS
jgi:hypothetical protein